MLPGCWVGRHRAPNPYFAVRNEAEGMWFGECPSCYETIVKPDAGRWQEVPEGKRVAWKGGTPSLEIGRSRIQSPSRRGLRGAVRVVVAWLGRLVGRRPPEI